MITRRDFLNGMLLGSGAALLRAAAPQPAPFDPAQWDGPGGIGDYASCHGNPWRVVEAAHRIREPGAAERLPAIATGEFFDLAIVGAGMSGLGAALHFDRFRRNEQTCLLLDNHPVFGGESKRNEFLVGAQRLLAPQGANEFDIPTDPQSDAYEIFERLRIPRRFEYQEWPEKLRPLEFDRTNYGFHHWIHAASFGHYMDGSWVRDFWRSSRASEELRKWKYQREHYYPGADYRRWLDTMTYQEYIEKVMGLSAEVTRYAHPILAAAMGLGCDALSAYAAYQIALPGFQGFPGGGQFPLDFENVPDTEWQMFPGGNTGFTRYIVRALIPEALPGPHRLNEIVNRPIRFAALDRRGAPFRLRLSATVLRVEQSRDRVTITYEKGGRLYRVDARAAVMAGGSWASRHIVAGLPAEKHEAFQHFFHSPVLVINVAVRQWRFLYDLGLTAARWTSGFGFSCNIRRQMVMPGYRPKLSPDAPNVITFYIPIYYPGLSPSEQGVKGRHEMLSTPFAGYEESIRDQMRKLWGAPGVEAIAGVIVNRWGHAYVNPTPGFYFGRGGQPAPPEVIRRPLGRVAFAHSELNGHQFWLGAIREGRRAVEQLRGAFQR